MSGKKFPVFNPATEEKLCEVEEGDKVGFPALMLAFFVSLHAALPIPPQLGSKQVMKLPFLGPSGKFFLVHQGSQ